LEKDLLMGRRAKAGCADALNELIEAHRACVVKVALEYRHLGVSLEDLLGEGNIGLVEAARRYDPGKRCKFVTYAMWWIRKSILKAVTRHAGSLTVSSHYRRKLREIRQVNRRLEASLGRRPHRDEIDASLRQPPGRAEILLALNHREIRLDAGSRGDGGLPLVDRIENPNVKSPEERLIRNETRASVLEALNDLGAKQRRVIALRFGFAGRDPLTLTEIGRAMGLSRERIRQIEQDGKSRLRRALTRRFEFRRRTVRHR
jgi:RNA polymerase primary sigma factor